MRTDGLNKNTATRKRFSILCFLIVLAVQAISRIKRQTISISPLPIRVGFFSINAEQFYGLWSESSRLPRGSPGESRGGRLKLL